MVSSGSGGGDAGDCGVGSIVWVRRRNGSWWPGKILGQEELSSTHLTSPRSGTPVKLLGRDDASVDWYNLEKSKRVKAFRCGEAEFDECIERAEASQGMPPKKREKYARREDAILHALELEKQLLRKQGKLAVTSDPTRSISSDSVKKEISARSEACDFDNRKSAVSESNQQLKRLDSSLQDESVDSPLDSQKTDDREQHDAVNGPSEVLPRLGGLQDFGLRVSQKRKRFSSGASDASGVPEVDNNLQIPSSDGPSMESMERATHSNGGEHTEGVLRAKKSKCLYLPTESDETLGHKETPRRRMEVSAFQFEEGDNYRPGALTIEENSSGFMEDDEPDSSESESETEADSSETEPDINEDMALLSGSSAPREVELRFRALGERRSLSSEEHDDMLLSGTLYHIRSHDPYSTNEAVSKWQLKGKRNVRNIALRSSMDVTDGRAFNGLYHQEKGTAFIQMPSGRNLNLLRKDDILDAFDEADLDDRDFCNHQMFSLEGGYACTRRDASNFQNSLSHIIDRHRLALEDQPYMRGHLGNRSEHFNPRCLDRYSYGSRARPMLIDVDLKVQASYKKAPVPIISLTSKLDGKSIIGHPIQVEVLDDGSSESLISANDIFGNEEDDHDESGMLQPAWRTARRSTNFRVPRPVFSSSALHVEMAAENRNLLDEERKQLKRSSMGNSFLKESSVKKSPRTTPGRKSPKKLGKKISSFSQKTRTLSSIGIDHYHSSLRSMHDSNGRLMNGLMKPESSGLTTVACIPVKLVFSRLLEKINTRVKSVE